MIRWIAVVVVGLAVLGSAYVFGLTWKDFLAQSQRMSEARSKLAQVEEAKRIKAAQMVEVAAWNQLWSEVRASRFDPDRWISTPVDLSRDLSWADFRELLLLVSNANALEAGYLFRPQTLRVIKIAPPARPGAELDPEEAAFMPINVHVQGEFLRMKGSDSR
jgi:hypothetical protein